MPKHKTAEASIHSFIYSAKRYLSTYYVAASGSDIREIYNIPDFLYTLVALLAGVAIIVAKGACHAI